MGLGIYINENTALAVKVEGSAKKPRVSKVAYLEFQPIVVDADTDPREARSLEFKAWLKKNKLLGLPVALCVDSGHVLFRDMNIAFSDRRQIDKVIAFQVEGLIPSTPIEDLAVGYTILDSKEDGSQLLVAAANKAPLREQLELLESAKTPAEVADSTVGGALNLRGYVPALNESDEATVWIDVQGHRAMMVVLKDGAPVSVRNLLVPLSAAQELENAQRVEGLFNEASESDPGDDTAEFEALEDDVDAAPEEPETLDARSSEPSFSAPLMSNDFVIENDEAESSTDSKQDNTSVFAYEAKKPKAEALIKLLSLELRRMLVSSQAGPIERVVLSGVPSALHGQLAPLKRDYNLNALEFVDLLDALLPKDRKGKAKIDLPPSPVIASVAGVALKQIKGGDLSGVDFLTGDLSPGDAFDDVKAPLAVGVTLLFLILGVVLMVVVRERSNLIQQRHGTIKELTLPGSFKAAYADADKKKPKYPSAEDPTDEVNAAAKVMDDQIAKIRGDIKSNYPPTFEADDIYRQFLKAVALLSQKMAPHNDFSLVSFKLSQKASGNKTGGSLTVVCYIDDDPTRYSPSLQLQLRNALEEIEVDNPVYNSRDKDSPRTIKAFQSVDYPTPESGKAVSRGERSLPNGKTELVTARKYTFKCELAEVERKDQEKSSGRRGRGR